MIKRVGGALTGLVLVLLALITGATPALAGRLARGTPARAAPPCNRGWSPWRWEPPAGQSPVR